MVTVLYAMAVPSILCYVYVVLLGTIICLEAGSIEADITSLLY